LTTEDRVAEALDYAASILESLALNQRAPVTKAQIEGHLAVLLEHRAALAVVDGDKTSAGEGIASGSRPELAKGLGVRADAPSLAGDVEALREALEEIHGCFIEGQRNTYRPGDQALDHIRQVAALALSRVPAGGEDKDG